jgi:hypothetical protein
MTCGADGGAATAHDGYASVITTEAIEDSCCNGDNAYNDSEEDGNAGIAYCGD